MPPVRRKKPKRRRTFLRQWREYRGLNQQQASERLEMSQGSLSRIERGVTPYDQDFLERAAFAYRCEPADLLMRDPTKEDSLWSLVDSLKKASPADQESVRRVTKALLDKAS